MELESIDFLPERLAAQRARRRLWVRQGYLLAVCAVLLAILGYTRQMRVSKAQAELSLLAERSVNVQRQLGMLQPLRVQQAELFLKKRIDEQLGSRVEALDVLAELERVLPNNVVLVSLDLEAMDIRHTGAGDAVPKQRVDFGADATQRRVRLVISGLAPSDVDVATFIAQVSSSKIFEDVNMGYSKSTEFRQRSARAFTVSCYVVR